MCDAKPKIIIVLGKRDSETIKKRMDIALSVYNSDNIMNEHTEGITYSHDVFILSGGIANTYSTMKTGAEELKMYAISQGVNKRYIITENESIDTVSNLINCKKIVDEMYPKTYDVSPTIVICSSSYHIKRVFVIAKILFKGNYILEFKDTNEKISNEEYEKESKILWKFL